MADVVITPIQGNIHFFNDASVIIASFTATSSNNLIITGNTGVNVTSNITVTESVTSNSYIGTIFTSTDGSSVDINPRNGGIQLWTLGASRTPTANNFQNGQSVTLMIDDGATYTITWPSVIWKTDSNTAPTLNITGLTAINLWKVSGNVYGARVGDS